MGKDKKTAKISYESEADVLSWEINEQTIDHALEAGNIVVHFSKNNTPVLVEILQASQFLNQANELFGKKKLEKIKV